MAGEGRYWGTNNWMDSAIITDGSLLCTFSWRAYQGILSHDFGGSILGCPKRTDSSLLLLRLSITVKHQGHGVPDLLQNLMLPTSLRCPHPDHLGTIGGSMSRSPCPIGEEQVSLSRLLLPRLRVRKLMRKFVRSRPYWRQISSSSAQGQALASERDGNGGASESPSFPPHTQKSFLSFPLHS